MGRSVSYLNNAETVIYFTADWINEVDDEYLSQINWEDFEANLKSKITAKLKSYFKSDGWDGRETKILLSNDLCNIGLSEYCGLYSLSVAPKDFDSYYPEDAYKENFSKHHAEQIEKTLVKCLEDCGCELLNKVGTFSTGCGVFKRAEKVFENSMQII